MPHFGQNLSPVIVWLSGYIDQTRADSCSLGQFLEHGATRTGTMLHLVVMVIDSCSESVTKRSR